MICLDVETTGLGELDEILSLSIIDADGRTLYDETFDPVGVEEWPEAQAINGISPEDVAGKPAIYEETPRIQAILDAADEVIGYNVGFDLGFLERAGLDVDRDKVVRDPQVDFAAVYGEYDGKHTDPRYQKLTTAAEAIGYDWGADKAHGSLADARASLALAKWLYGPDAGEWEKFTPFMKAARQYRLFHSDDVYKMFEGNIDGFVKAFKNAYLKFLSKGKGDLLAVPAHEAHGAFFIACRYGDPDGLLCSPVGALLNPENTHSDRSELLAAAQVAAIRLAAVRESLTRAAEAVDAFAYDFDPYEYADSVGTWVEGQAQAKEDLLANGGKNTLAFLEDAVDPYNDNHPEDVARAERLLPTVQNHLKRYEEAKQRYEELKMSVEESRERMHPEDIDEEYDSIIAEAQGAKAAAQAAAEKGPDWQKKTEWISAPKGCFEHVSNIYSDDGGYDLFTPPRNWSFDGMDLSGVKFEIPPARESKFNEKLKCFRLPLETRGGEEWTIRGRKTTYVAEEDLHLYDERDLKPVMSGKHAGQYKLVELVDVPAARIEKAFKDNREAWKAEKQQDREQTATKSKTADKPTARPSKKAATRQ